MKDRDRDRERERERGRGKFEKSWKAKTFFKKKQCNLNPTMNEDAIFIIQAV